MTDKPSRNEDEYFARQERETLDKSREQIRLAALQEERRSHYMKCPKDGADLATESFHGVQLERCPECNGLWLDAGEIDAVVAHEDKGIIGRVFGDVMATFRRKDKK
jgi:Zn-finger nucleic acid-binding protein